MGARAPIPELPAVPVSDGLPVVPAVRPGSPRCTALPAWLWPTTGAVASIDALDGLRGVAVLLTAWHHLVLQIHDFPGTTKSTADFLGATVGIWGIGNTGVHLFFVLSGFLLFLPYARTLLGLQSFPSTGKFYRRRALRILPAYWVSLPLMLIFFVPQFLTPSAWYDLVSHVLLIHNFSSSTFYSIHPPYWTMAIESQFYLLLPLLAGLAAWLLRTGRPRLVIGLVLLLVASSPLFSRGVVLLRPGLPQLDDYIGVLSLLRFLSVFALGMLCSVLYVAVTQGPMPEPAQKRIRVQCKLFGLVGVSLLLTIMLIRAGALPVQDDELYLYNLILGLAYASILLGTVLGWPSWRRVLSQPAIRFVGMISYSLYIWNAPFYAWIVVPLSGRFGSDLLTFLLGILLTGVITIPCCFVFYHCVERPFLTAGRIQH